MHAWKPQVLVPALRKHGVVVHIFNLDILRSGNRRIKSLMSTEHACGDRYKSEELVPTLILL